MIRLSVVSVFVQDQCHALDFYTTTLGFTKAKDTPLGSDDGARWLTVTAPGGPDGIELLLEPGDGPIAEPYQCGLYEAGIPAAVFEVGDLDAEYERLSALGVAFSAEPTDGPEGVRVATFDDTCGNYIQLVQPDSDV